MVDPAFATVFQSNQAAPVPANAVTRAPKSGSLKNWTRNWESTKANPPISPTFESMSCQSKRNI